MIVLQAIIVGIFLVLAVNGFLHRNMPQVGGKIGRIKAIYPPVPPPEGFSRVYARVTTVFVGTDAAGFPTLRDYLLKGPVRKPMVMRVYCVAGCKTEIEIPEEAADYERIDAAEALALLRELPDPRLVRRLHLSDERSFLDPWLRKVRSEHHFTLGNATNFSLVVLYKPDRRLEHFLGVTLLHEWLHLVAFAATIQLWRFKRADAIEPLPPAEAGLLDLGNRNTAVYEAWCDLGEKLFGYDEPAARQAALALPVHATILWFCVERILRRTPRKFRSTRFDELMRRGEFMRAEVAPQARRSRSPRRP
jgi:hypothetical protein